VSLTALLFVRVRNSEGKYLTEEGGHLGFCSDIQKARIFDCRRDRVEHQLAYLRLIRGLVLEVEPVDPKEIHETCDCCGRLALSFQMYFDGKRYLCEQCRNRSASNFPSS
jgi:hypothetical protein